MKCIFWCKCTKCRFSCLFMRQVCKVFKIPYFKCVCLLSVLFFVTVPFLSISLPFSPLFRRYNKEDDVFEYVKKVNEHRLEGAYEYFKKLDNRTSQEFYKGKSIGRPDMVVCIVTVSRSWQTSKTGYLIQTAAATDKIIKMDAYFPNTLLFVCNVDREPKNHIDAVFLQNYIPYVQKNGTNFWNKPFPVANVTMHNKIKRRGQELADYTFCLNTSMTWGSPYILMLEDDVVPYENIFRVLHFTMTQHKFIHSSHLAEDDSSKKHEFAFLKLYYPERWQGYANELDRIVELISIGILGGGLFYGILSLTARCFRKEISYVARWFYYVLGSLITIFVACLSGRQNVMDVRRLSPQLFKFGPTPACCTPAMLYSSHIIPDLMNYLLHHSEVNKDLAINDFIVTRNIPGYMLEPNLVRHIGMFTSLESAHKSPYEFVLKDR